MSTVRYIKPLFFDFVHQKDIFNMLDFENMIYKDKLLNRLRDYRIIHEMEGYPKIIDIEHDAIENMIGSLRQYSEQRNGVYFYIANCRLVIDQLHSITRYTINITCLIYESAYTIFGKLLNNKVRINDMLEEQYKKKAFKEEWIL